MRRDAEYQAAEYQAVVEALSHDIKAPLRAVHGFAEALREPATEKLEAPNDRYLHHVITGTDKVLRMLEPLVAYCRLGGDGPRQGRVDLHELIDQQVTGTRAALAADQAHVALRCEALVLRTDREMLRIAIVELLRNALLFTPNGTAAEVCVSAGVEADCVRIVVEDRGIGMDSRDVERIFHLFSRMRPEAEYPGVGMGLPMADKAIALLGGRLEIVSDPGVGTTAEVLLPLGEAVHVV